MPEMGEALIKDTTLFMKLFREKVKQSPDIGVNFVNSMIAFFDEENLWGILMGIYLDAKNRKMDAPFIPQGENILNAEPGQ